MYLDVVWVGVVMICFEFCVDYWVEVEGFDSIVFNFYKWFGV